MAKLGSKQNPLMLNIHSEELLETITKTCTERGWFFMAGINLTEPENLTDFERKLNPPTTSEHATPKLSRNEPCLCGSGKKYKKCCINEDIDLLQ